MSFKLPLLSNIPVYLQLKNNPFQTVFNICPKLKLVQNLHWVILVPTEDLSNQYIQNEKVLLTQKKYSEIQKFTGLIQIQENVSFLLPRIEKLIAPFYFL
jgi:hypothetical protein